MQYPVDPAQCCQDLGSVLSLPIPSRNGTKVWMFTHLSLTCLSTLSTLPSPHLSWAFHPLLASITILLLSSS